MTIMVVNRYREPENTAKAIVKHERMCKDSRLELTSGILAAFLALKSLLTSRSTGCNNFDFKVKLTLLIGVLCLLPIS